MTHCWTHSQIAPLTVIIVVLIAPHVAFPWTVKFYTPSLFHNFEASAVVIFYVPGEIYF